MAIFRISIKAEQDLANIGFYTKSTWGLEQSKIYLLRLDKCFHFIAQNPDIGKNCDNIRDNYRKYPEGTHVIFYRINQNNVVEIMRILHQQMDVELNLQ